MKALLINVIEKKIQEIELTNFDIDAKSLIGNGCNWLQWVPYHFPNNKDMLWCDEEGLFQENTGGFTMEGWYPILGNGIIVGSDGNDLTDSYITKKEDVEKIIHWVSIEDCDNYEPEFSITFL